MEVLSSVNSRVGVDAYRVFDIFRIEMLQRVGERQSASHQRNYFER
jgi:sRNA-binding carbon storage regulator CsrA